VQLALDGLDGIKQARVLIAAKRLEVVYDPQHIDQTAIEQAVRRAPAMGQSGHYDAEPVTGASGTPTAAAPQQTVE
jgi:cation transport ATPase